MMDTEPRYRSSTRDANEIKGQLNNFFLLSSFLAVVGWVFLILLPDWSHTFTVTRTAAILIASIYFNSLTKGLKSLGLQSKSEYDDDEDNPGYIKSISSFKGVLGMFRNSDDATLLAMWVHYLCFDLLIGELIVRDSQVCNVPWPLVILSLLLTLAFGPVGFGFFSALKFLFP